MLFAPLSASAQQPATAAPASRPAPQPEPETVVRRLIDEVTPEQLAGRIFDNPETLQGTLGPISAVLDLEGYAGSLPAYLAATARELGARVAAAGPPWSEADLDLVLNVLLVNPGRYTTSDRFRRMVNTILPWAQSRSTPREFRDRLLVELNRVEGVDFELSEIVEVAWGGARRASAAFKVDVPETELKIGAEAPIEATVLSLPSPFIDPVAAERLISELERTSPGRTLLVLTDHPLRQVLAPGRAPSTALLETHGRPYTPWLRDPLLIASHRAGGVVLVERPNRQPEREEDSLIGRELIQQLPDDVRARWRRVGWQTGATPFHSGQIVLVDDAAWISLNSVEEAILARLGMAQVPVDSFRSAGGVDAYLTAARAAAADLERLLQRRVRFVHPLPDTGSDQERYEALMRIGGGAGFDLDSLVSILPGGEVSSALVADLDAGLALVDSASADELAALAGDYGLRGPEALPAALAAYAAKPRGRRLATFLDEVATHLAEAGLSVARLPHLLVPTAQLADNAWATHRDFQITWNNVVLERRGDRRRAEGFAAGLAAGDQIARQAFAAAGWDLVLLPPLIASIVRNGGYRCASNHLRVWLP